MTHIVKSTEKLNKNSARNGFIKDENGHFHIVPMKLPPIICVSTKKTGEKSTTTRRKYIPIQPLKFSPSDFLDSPQQTAKKPRLESQVRKELYKVPQKKGDGRFSRYSTRRSVTAKQTSSIPKEKVIKKTLNNDKSPLIDAEKLLTQHKLTPQPLKTVSFYASRKKCENIPENTPKKLPLARIDETPSSTEAMAELEFLCLEKALASATKPAKKFSSPMTSVCNLLAKTKIASSSKKSKEEKGILNNILTLLKEDRIEFESLKEHFSKYEIQREKRLNDITTLIEENFENKENSPNRRSIRIASQAVKTKFVVSPAISQKVDLRKKALNKNLSMNFQCESPRTKNAMHMYNAFRTDCSVLSTPKLDRTNIEATQNSATRSLSRRIQNQCLLLQDTPRV